ncbi:MAG: hypothetical protein GY835_22225 [bacterium]|nr:hypothetical protein [bacterium]
MDDTESDPRPGSGSGEPHARMMSEGGPRVGPGESTRNSDRAHSAVEDVEAIEGGDETAADPHTPPERGKSATEREMLRVLWNNRDRHLLRGEIHKLIPALLRPTPGRISQILRNLRDAGLLTCTYRRAQGSARAACYALSEKGRKLCRDRGMDREVQVLFPRSEKILNDYLTAERIAAGNTAPGRIVAFHAHRGGVGQSTTVAHCARLLASQPNRGERDVLVVDFDLDASALDDHFAPERFGGCRGLCGLIADYHQVRAAGRPAWLREALTHSDSDYVLQPFPETPNLFYLPSGFAADLSAAVGGQRAEAMARLWDEAALSSATAGGNRESPDATRGSFLDELRKAVLDLFDKTLIDSQPGTSIGAWAATQVLADELILCLRLTATNTEALRAVLANYLRRQEDRDRPGRVGFAFAHLKSRVQKQRLSAWIEEHVLSGTGSATGSVGTRTVALKYEPRLIRGATEDLPLAKVFRPLISLLERSADHEEPEEIEDEVIPLAIRLLAEEVSMRMKEEESAEITGILRGMLVSSLGHRRLASLLKSSSLREILDDELIAQVDRTEEVMSEANVTAHSD